MSINPSPTDPALSVLNRLKEAYSLIGAIIVTSGHLEQALADAVRFIEGYAAIRANIYPIPYSDLDKLRDFKRRKGHLRKLVEQYGSKDQLHALDEIYRKMIAPSKIRHACGHEMVFVHEDQNPPSVEFYSPDDQVSPEEFGTLQKMSLAELSNLYCQMYLLPFELTDLSRMVDLNAAAACAATTKNPPL